MRDQQSELNTVIAVPPGTYTDDPAALIVDTAGFEAITFVLSIGAGGIVFNDANRIDAILEHSDDGFNWQGIIADMTLPVLPPPPGDQNMRGSLGRVLSVKAAHPDPTVHRWGYIGGISSQWRYVRIRVDFVGTHAKGTGVSAVVVRGHGRELPVAA